MFVWCPKEDYLLSTLAKHGDELVPSVGRPELSSLARERVKADGFYFLAREQLAATGCIESRLCPNGRAQVSGQLVYRGVDVRDLYGILTG